MTSDNCAVCGERTRYDDHEIAHSCAGRVPASNLPDRDHGLVSISEMNRRIAEAVAVERAAIRELEEGKRKAEAERDEAKRTKTIICMESGESPSADDLQVVAEYAEVRRFRRALENIYMLARRERRKSAEAQAGAWDRIVRFCREAGLKTSVLRSEATVNAVETAEAAKRDTARLFWLETSGAWAWAEWYIGRGIQPDGLGLRAAIDAAMQANEPEGA